MFGLFKKQQTEEAPLQPIVEREYETPKGNKKFCGKCGEQCYIERKQKLFSTNTGAMVAVAYRFECPKAGYLPQSVISNGHGQYLVKESL
jgi:hypothetical protein